jgi:hypothetical protein
MILLDEQIRDDQRDLLTGWRIRFRQIGREVAAAGIKDPDIIPWLQSLKQPTFFTHDRWFYQSQLCHPDYCLVWLDLRDVEAARFVRLLLRNPLFQTHASRLGRVVRLHHEGIDFWEKHKARPTKLPWLS